MIRASSAEVSRRCTHVEARFYDEGGALRCAHCDAARADRLFMFWWGLATGLCLGATLAEVGGLVAVFR